LRNSLQSGSRLEMAKREVDQCIVRALGKLGESTSEVIFYHLETRFGITTKDASTDSIRLGWGLQGIFGKATPYVIDLILDEANSVKSPSEGLLHFARGLKTYREAHFPNVSPSSPKRGEPYV